MKLITALVTGLLLTAFSVEAKVINIADWESEKKVMPYSIPVAKRKTDYTNSAKDNAQCATACNRSASCTAGYTCIKYVQGKTCTSAQIKVSCPVAGCSAWAICIATYD